MDSARTYIEQKIDKLAENQIFSAKEFITKTISHNTARMALERLVQAGKIRKLTNGKYYKPHISMFGELQPAIEQQVADLLYDKNKIIGYITGVAAFSRLGLTTQISAEIKIGTNKYRRAIRRGNYTISFVLQPNTITRENIELLQILDAVRFIKEIPATTPNEVVEILSKTIAQLPSEKQMTLARLALKYTASVRALVGAMLKLSNADQVAIDKLRASLNSLTTYRLNISPKILPNKQDWHIL